MTVRTARIGRPLAALGLTAALVAGPAAAGSAHVAVDASSDTAGDYSVLTFRVPTESDTASTVKVDTHLPTETPFTSVRVLPVEGWSAELVRTDFDTPVQDSHGNTLTSAVTEVIWTATGDGIAPDEFGEFTIQVGPLPDSGTVYFPTVQTYSDGTSAAWSQQADPSQPEPATPAPLVTVAEADTADDSTDASPSGEASGALWAIAAGGATAAIGALVLSVIALRRAGRR